MTDEDLMDSLEREFGEDPNLWPDPHSQEFISWRARCTPEVGGPETKTMQELNEELKMAQHTLQQQANAEVRTMNMIDCEADVSCILARIERLKLKDTF